MNARISSNWKTFTMLKKLKSKGNWQNNTQLFIKRLINLWKNLTNPLILTLNWLNSIKSIRKLKPKSPKWLSFWLVIRRPKLLLRLIKNHKLNKSKRLSLSKGKNKFHLNKYQTKLFLLSKLKPMESKWKMRMVWKTIKINSNKSKILFPTPKLKHKLSSRKQQRRSHKRMVRNQRKKSNHQPKNNRNLSQWIRSSLWSAPTTYWTNSSKSNKKRILKNNNTKQNPFL